MAHTAKKSGSDNCVTFQWPVLRAFSVIVTLIDTVGILITM